MFYMPTPTNCPMKRNGVCICNPPKQCNEIPPYECSANRSAYHYGYQIAEIESCKAMNELVEGLNKVIEKYGWEDRSEDL